MRKNPTAPKPENVCSRHGGWKVITDGGRSWRCAYGNEERLLICSPASWRRYTEGTQGQCDVCGRSVWVSNKTTTEYDITRCILCVYDTVARMIREK
jgi:hypothetical protein